MLSFLCQTIVSDDFSNLLPRSASLHQSQTALFKHLPPAPNGMNRTRVSNLHPIERHETLAGNAIPKRPKDGGAPYHQESPSSRLLPHTSIMYITLYTYHCLFIHFCTPQELLLPWNFWFSAAQPLWSFDASSPAVIVSRESRVPHSSTEPTKEIK